MAEKEERYISITQMVAKENIETEKYRVMSRQEAMNRMAKAMCNMGDEETWGRVDDNYKHYCTAQAEWALNALLEGK